MRRSSEWKCEKITAHAQSQDAVCMRKLQADGSDAFASYASKLCTQISAPTIDKLDVNLGIAIHSECADVLARALVYLLD